ncbi:MAG: 23S rRNA (uracil(1939)-C(5))-methyltransferase RlmD [Brachymonas sp.]
MARYKVKGPEPAPREYVIDSLDIEAQGVARAEDGKVVFIDSALPGERVTAITRRSKNNWEAADLVAIHKTSSLRVKPECPHFGLHVGACGGCKMQHLEPSAQVAIKQRALEDQLWHLGKVKPDLVLRPIQGPDWGYRYRARLSMRYVRKKDEVLIGFHERASRYLADMQTCVILPPRVSSMLLPLRALVKSMEARETLPQIELACGDDVTALVLRHLEPLSEGDIAKLREFAAQHGVQWWLQPKGPETVKLLDEAGSVLAYALPEFGITMPFKPTDFTQVNPQINRVLVTRALRLLDVRKTDRVIDWFCGLGNFTLPLATQAREVVGIEGSDTLVMRAKANAAQNLKKKQPIAGTDSAQGATDFVARNLFEMTGQMLVDDGYANRWLIDPPREGAFALVKALAQIHQQRLGNMPEVEEGKPAPQPVNIGDWQPPQRIVYVSCNPSTLARDAGLLVHQAGYHCAAAGVVNMFPHTAHVESMAVFELS